MDVTSSFVSRSVTSTANLNWVFLVDWIIVFFAAVVFIFYFNRLLGYLITLLINEVFWRRRNKKISIQAVKINFLGGRVFMKNVMVMTPNEMVMMHTVVLTWKYWLRSVRKSQFYVQEEKLNDALNRKLPIRITGDIVGLEVFLYNRSVAYDEIEKVLKAEERAKKSKKAETEAPITSKSPAEFPESNLKRRTTKSFESSTCFTPSDDITNFDIPSKMQKNTSGRKDASSAGYCSAVDDCIAQKEVMDSTFLDFLPLEINVTKGAFILGNETTPQLFVASYSSLMGNIDATFPGSPLDYYRTHYDFTVSDLEIKFKTNVSFKNIEALERKIRDMKNKKHSHSISDIISGMGHSLKILHEKFNKKPNVHSQDKDSNSDSFLDETKGDNEEWHGLERYLTESSSEDSSFSNLLQFESETKGLEYAKCSNILHSEICKLNYYYDSQGLVPQDNPFTEYTETPDLGNKDIAPMFGLDITVHGTSVTYGPWAEKNRGALHQLLFPSLFRDTIPFKKLDAGMRRQYASFDLSVECADELVMRIPHREESKDMLFSKGNLTKSRPYGWVDLKLGSGSVIDASIAMVSTLEKGTDNRLNAVFVKPVLSTSVNHDILFEADEHVLNASTAFPLQWNSLVDWTFENISKNANLYLLREHITLISDLFGDFASGEPTPYELFRPFIYHFNWKFYDYAIYLNINEKNIINNPLDHNVNTFITFKGSDLFLDTAIPITSAFKKSNKIDYVLETTYFDLSVEHPAFSTFSNFMQDERIGNANNFKLEGSYTMYSFVEIDSIDTIIMNCTCDDTTLKAYGFVVKYFLSLKENYFGDNTHFKNLLEFRDSFGKNNEEHPWEGKRLKNETDVMFSFRVSNGCLIFPCHLYDCASHLALHFDALDIDLRNNNYYMDLQANFSDIQGRYISECTEDTIFPNTKKGVDFTPEIIVDELSVHSIRIFGLPPSEPTYYCRWTFDSNEIRIHAEPIFIHALSSAGKSFQSGYSDLENSLSIPEITVMDILNLSFKCDLIEVIIKHEAYSINVNLDDLFFKLSDQPTTLFNSMLVLQIKNILISGYRESLQILKLKTSLEMKNFMQKKDAFERMKQQAFHLKKHDAPFHRVPFLIPEFAKDRKYYKSLGSMATSLNYFDPPLPLTNQGVDWLIDSFPLHIQRRLVDIAATFDDFNVDYDDSTEPGSNIEDFTVLSSLDSNCAYNNSTICLGTIEAFVSPYLVPLAVDMVTNMTDFNMYSVLDDLQTQFITFFKYKQEDEVSRFKIECPVISLKLCEDITSTDYCFFGITELSLAFSDWQTSAKQAFNLYAIVKSIQLTIKKEYHDAFDAALFNVLIKNSTEKRSISTFDLENITIFFDPLHIDWVLDLAFKYKDIIQDSIEDWKLHQKNEHSAQVELLYDLSKGGIEYNISHDPPCITKPSYISGFCNNHIRMDGNWMIIPRLRHVLNNLPPDLLQAKNSQFKRKSWEAPKNAEEEVSMIFGNWRCWDNHKTKDNFIFKTVFESDDKVKEKLMQTIKFTLKTITVNLAPLGDCFISTNIFLFLNEDFLDDAVKTVATPLLDQPIETGLDVTIKLGTVVTQFSKLARVVPVVIETLNIFSDKVLKFKEKEQALTEEDWGSNVSLNDVERYLAIDPKLITVNFTLEEFSHTIGIESSVLKVYGHGTSTTASIIKAEEMLSCTLNFKNDFFSTELNIDGLNVVEVRHDGHEISFVNTGSVKSGKSTFSFNYNTINIIASPTFEEIIHALDCFAREDLPIVIDFKAKLKNILDLEEKTDTKMANEIESSAQDIFSSNIFEKVSAHISAVFNIKKINLRVDFLSPFYIIFEILNPLVALRVGDFGIFSEYQMNLKLLIGSQNLNNSFHYCTLSIDKFKTLLTSRYEKNFYDMFCEMMIGQFRLNLSQNNLITILSKFKHDVVLSENNLEVLKQRIDHLRELGDLSGSAETNSVKLHDDTKSTADFIKSNVRFLLKLNANSLNSNITINGNKFFLDFQKPSLDLKNFDTLNSFTSFHGEVQLPSISISMGLSGSHGYSTIFDMQGTVQVLNPKSMDQTSQNLNITSKFCRIFLNPHIMEELIEIYGELAVCVDHSHEKVDRVVESNFEEKMETILSFFSIQIASENVCFGWLFEEENVAIADIPPGLIYGFEKMSIVCTKGAGKIQTDGMYLSTAHGFRPNNFFSTRSEKTSNNRVYFPQFHLIYTFDKNSDVTAIKSQVEGDVVDFKFQTDIFSIMEPLWLSINMLQEKFSRVEGNVKEKRIQIEHESINDSVSLHSNSSHIKVLSCSFKFKGASFYIFNSSLEIDGSIPILSLQSPGLSAALKYTHDLAAIKKHSIFLSAKISETHNKLSCLCVPVLRDIAKRIKISMKKSSYKKVVKPKVEPSVPIDFVSLSEKMDVNFSLKIEPQSLSLSCEPRANIEAIVAIDVIQMIFKTEQDFLSAIISVKGLKAELKHAYSKVTSGSVSANKLTVNSTMSIVDGEKKFAAVGHLQESDFFVNIQQRQDLDLFKDFWLPSELNDVSFLKKHNEVTTNNKTFSSMLREVSTTSAFPWVLSLFITNLSARVDLGSSLGELVINMHDFTAFSQKSMNWDHSLKLEFETITLVSQGRLSGMLSFKKVRVTTAISWKRKLETLDIPLVLLAFGFHSLESRISLDYHPFLIVQLMRLGVTVYNQRQNNCPDKLKSNVTIGSLKIFMTALTASNFVDVYTIGLRIRQDIRLSYRQVLNDAKPHIEVSTTDDDNNLLKMAMLNNKSLDTIFADEKIDEETNMKTPSQTFLHMIEKLRTYLDFSVGSLEIQVFPSSLLDPQAMVIKIGKCNAMFYQNSVDRIENKVFLDLADITISLSSYKRKITLEALNDPNGIDSYINLANGSIADNIFSFPSLKIGMFTQQEFDTNVVNYKYHCKFGGRVDIKWKIGSAYFIRQMWYSHATTLNTRLTALKFYTSDEYSEETEENYKTSTFESVNLGDRLRDVESDKSYVYKFLEIPDIETPQIKDLGNATPPLEWFGLHRDKFPNLTHQFVVIGLQKMVKEVEQNYSKVLK